MKTLLGVDIGGTKIAAGIVSEEGRLLWSAEVPTRASEGGEAVLRRALALARQLREEAALRHYPRPVAIGVGAGGQIDSRTGVVLSATDLLPGWAGTGIKEAFEKESGLPTFVDNDVNALAIGEMRFGAGKGCQNLVFLALGTGVGGAIISNGQLHYSKTGVSGELGHLILFPDGVPCTCGGQGCLEQYASGPALLRTYQEQGGSQETPGENLLQEAINAPDGPAAVAIRVVGERLGLGITSLVNLFGPEKVIVGGGVVRLGDRLLEPARQRVAQRAMWPVRQTEIVPASLGPEASLVGAASLTLVSASGLVREIDQSESPAHPNF